MTQLSSPGATLVDGEPAPASTETTPIAPAWRPKPLIAALLNLIPGLGLVYAGQLVVGLVFSAIFTFWVLSVFYVSCLLNTPGQRLAILAFGFAVQFMGLPLIGYIAAARTSAAPKRSYQEWYVLLGYPVTYAVLASMLIRVVAPPAGNYRFPGVSMSPTLLPNDRMVALSVTGDLHRGDVVVFAFGNGQFGVRRIVGLPGDTVELRDFHAIVNGMPEVPRLGPCLHEDTPATWSADTRARANFGPVTVSAGRYAVFGDCRDNANDTRTWGFVPREVIVKRVIWIWWSSDQHGTRYDRIGQLVK